MEQVIHSLRELQGNDPDPGCRYITTSLYELIETISEELRPGEEELLGKIVTDLAGDQQIQFVETDKYLLTNL
ncbi:MAG: hypothetical protein ACOC6E_03195 [Thermodesulfobacteriota bacterium]